MLTDPSHLEGKVNDGTIRVGRQKSCCQEDAEQLAGGLPSVPRTTIEWTDTTWNPVTGCTKVSPARTATPRPSLNASETTDASE